MNEQQSSAPTQSTPGTDQSTAAREIVPGVTEEMAPLAQAPAEKQLRVRQLLNEIDVSNTQSVLFFGSKAQELLTTISDRMLDGVQNKDIGPAADDLNEMVATIRGFEADDLDPNKKQGIFDRMLGRAKPVVKFLQQYEEVRKQIDTITDKLERHKTHLLTDIVSLDKLYQANLDYFHTLE
ncbi:MAG: toxic anion resistance protein, partial [Methylosarcina sp.]